MSSGKDTFITNQIPFTGLVIAATPIGNLGDLTPRVEAALHAADMIACEDTRHTGKLLAKFGINTKMIPYHDHSEGHVLNGIISALREGRVIVLVSDAGTPLISDPGYQLVAACRAEGISVTSLPGASAAAVNADSDCELASEGGAHRLARPAGGRAVASGLLLRRRSTVTFGIAHGFTLAVWGA